MATQRMARTRICRSTERGSIPGQVFGYDAGKVRALMVFAGLIAEVGVILL
jgi:hypothetical protein